VAAGTALYGETDPQRETWVKTQTLDILSSRVNQVLARLEESLKTMAPTSQAAKALRRVVGYLQRNRSYMDYARYLKRGWPIGTGVIEVPVAIWSKTAWNSPACVGPSPEPKPSWLCARFMRMVIGIRFISSAVSNGINDSMASHSSRRGSIRLRG